MSDETPDQLSADDLKAMSPQQIHEARKAGRFRDALAGNVKSRNADTEEN